MGSFGGVKFDAQNFQDTVTLAQQKELLEKSKIENLAQSLKDYRNNLANYTFPDGQYYVAFDFNSQKINFQGDAYNPNLLRGVMPVVRKFKKGELVSVVTIATNMAGNLVKVIKTNDGYFYADQNNLSKVKPVESVSNKSLLESKKLNNDKTILIIIGAFVLGLLLSND